MSDLHLFCFNFYCCIFLVVCYFSVIGVAADWAPSSSFILSMIKFISFLDFSMWWWGDKLSLVTAFVVMLTFLSLTKISCIWFAFIVSHSSYCRSLDFSSLFLSLLCAERDVLCISAAFTVSLLSSCFNLQNSISAAEMFDKRISSSSISSFLRSSF